MSPDTRAQLAAMHRAVESVHEHALNVLLCARRAVSQGESPDAIVREFESCAARFIDDVNRIGRAESGEHRVTSKNSTRR